MAGPPWLDVPKQWVFDGHRIGVIVPPTTDLVQALLIDNEACGMWILTATMDRFDAMWMYSRIFEPELPLVQFDLLDEIADTLVARIVGIPRWTATAIWKETLGAWPLVDGELQARGINVTDLPPHRATNAVIGVWRGFYSGGDGFSKWWDKMNREPTRVLIRELEREDDESAANDFAAVMALSQGVQAAPRVEDSQVVDQIPDTLQ
jgi:hypothetical protein